MKENYAIVAALIVLAVLFILYNERLLRALDEGAAKLETAATDLRDELAAVAETMVKMTQPHEIAVTPKHYGFRTESA